MTSVPFLLSGLLALGLTVGVPSVVAHVGHGDEFQAEGGIDRVPVNAETDALLGIEMAPIEATPDGSAAVLIPVTSLVDNDGQSLVFVQYENFYEPVPVTTGATQGDLIEVTEGLSVGEMLVTQGSLSLYAESRKTQTASESLNSAETASSKTTSTNTTSTNTEASQSPVKAEALSASNDRAERPEQSAGLPMGIIGAIGGGVVLAGGAIAVLSNRKKQKSPLSDNQEGV